jgi:hypothetical protein
MRRSKRHNISHVIESAEAEVHMSAIVDAFQSGTEPMRRVSDSEQYSFYLDTLRVKCVTFDVKERKESLFSNLAAKGRPPAYKLRARALRIPKFNRPSLAPSITLRNVSYLSQLHCPTFNMSANVGLSTPRGSGTSGYIQANRSHLRPRERDRAAPYSMDEYEKHKQRKPDKDILEHERKRKIEVKVFELRDKLEEEG